MRVVVIGSGLIGLTTAHSLRRRGHEVVVIEREEGPALETSFANGALLTPSMCGPWNEPGCWRVLLASLARSDAPLQLRFGALPSLVGWGLKFLRNSNPEIFGRNALRNLCLAQYSLNMMESLRQETRIDYWRDAQGTLRLFRNDSALDCAVEAADRLVPYGLTYRRVSTAKTVELEPALVPIAPDLAGALYYPADETGDAYRFCVALADYLRERGVEFRFGTDVSALEERLGRITALLSGQRRVVADRYIIAAGSHSTPILRRIGIRLPVRPAKGYSVTFDRAVNDTALRIPFVDDELHAVIVPLNGGIRVAGTAEFAGYDLALQSDRIRNLLALLRRVLPQSRLDPATGKQWCGLRPMSEDGVPIIGATPIANLFVNTGHGHLGWTMAAGSAEILADLVCGDTPPIDPAPYALARFEPVRCSL